MKKIIHKNNAGSWILFLIGLITGLIFYPRLPQQIPMHFNGAGVVDGYGSPITIFLLPGVMLALILLAEIFKNIDPKTKVYAMFPKQYYLIYFLTGLVLLVIELYIIATSLNIKITNINNILPVILGVLFIGTGNAMPKFKHNYFVGIRTSWTLADEDVWFQTHRLGGKIWVAGGIIIILAVFLPNILKFIVLGTVFAVIVIVPIVYSYVKFREKRESGEEKES